MFFASSELTGEIAALMALRDDEYYQQRYAETHLLRNEFTEVLKKVDSIEVTPTIANFILCHFPENGPGAELIVSKRKEKGLFIRNISNMGTNVGTHTIRIAIKDRETNQRMLKILGEVLLLIKKDWSLEKHDTMQSMKLFKPFLKLGTITFDIIVNVVKQLVFRLFILSDNRDFVCRRRICFKN